MTQSTQDPLPFSCVVGIGASAGGLNALKDFFAGLKGHRLAFVVIQHLDTFGKDLALEALRTITSYEVVEISEGLALEPSRIFLAAPHTLVGLHDGYFQLNVPENSDQRRSTIDYFLTALANDQQEKSIGVILSGDGSDGTEGLKAIGDAGGMTMAQDPDSAEHSSMPRAAISTGAVDHILPAAAMTDEILSYEKYLLRLLDQTRITMLRDQIGSALLGICEILCKATGHDFKHYKTNTLVRRIQRRMQVLQLREVETYVELLQSKSEEVEALFKELLINVTSFFRDPGAFEELRTAVLEKALSKHPPTQKFRVWIAGCSTGEEAYSLAIILREIASTLKRPPEIQIIATDIDEVALNAARRGSYPNSISEDVSPERLKKFFVRKNGRYFVTKDLRDMCLFSSHNLINDPPFSQLDLLTCRNVLIYLGPHLQQKLIPVFHYALKSNGCLFLGTSESLTGHQDLFRTINAKYRIAERRATAIRSQPSIKSVGQFHPPRPNEPLQTNEMDLNLIGQRIILDEFSPKYAIVNDEGQVVSVSAGVNRYFEPSEGLFHNNIFKLVNPGLRAALRSTFKAAHKHKRKTVHEFSAMELDGNLQRIGIVVQPMPQLGEGMGLFMVVFQYFGQLSAPESETATRETTIANIAAVEQLERELVMMREDLDKTVQDLEASNEELKSTNEELLSMNEELQTANEELENTKDDVQSANDALLQSNTDLENLLASTEIATLFLDDSHRIKSFTPAISHFYSLLPGDIGREIGVFSTKASHMPAYPLRQELATPGVSELEVTMPDGRTYLRRIVPYTTHEGLQKGLVVTFVDISDLRQSEGRFQNLANMVPSITWTSNAEGRIDYFNSRWTEYTGLTVADSLDCRWIDAIHPEDVEFLREEWRFSMETGEDFQGEFRIRRADGIYRWYMGRGVATRGRSGKISQWFGTCNDIEAQKVEVDLLKESGDGLRTIVETIPQYIWRTNADGAADYCSESFLTFVGQTRDKVLGWSWVDLILSDDQEFVRNKWSAARLEQRAVIVEFRIKLEGKERWIRSEGNPYFDAMGQLVKYYGTWTDIHERVMAERSRVEVMGQMELERQKFEALFADSPSAMALLRGPQFVLEKANSKFHEMSGKPMPIGKPIREILPEVVESNFLDLLNDVYSTGSPCFRSEARSIIGPANGGEEGRFVDFAIQRVNDDRGKPYGVYLHSSDVSDKVNARIRIEQSKRLAEFSEREVLENLESMADGFFSLDSRFCITRINSRVEELMDLKREAVLGRSLWDAFPGMKKSALRYWTEMNRVMTERKESRFIEYYEPLNLWTSASVFPKADGGLSVFFQDVTEQNLARIALQESESRFRLLADAMPQIVFTADAFGNFNYFNRRWFEYTNTTFDQAQGWGWKSVIHPDDLERCVESWTHSFTTGEPYQIEYRLKGGSDESYRWHLGRAIPIVDSADKITRWFGTNTDIHESKVLTEELLLAKQNADLANQTKSRFLANMSHEIRTPLGVIIGFTDLLREQLEGQTEVSTYVARIASNAQQLGSLIDEILDLSKIEADRLESDPSEVDLRLLLDDVFSNMKMIAEEKGLSFQENWLTAAPKRIITDPNRFRQILVNVIGNAIKFTDHGKIEVDLAIAYEGDDRSILVRVKDTGIGLNEEQQQRIFEPFIQADSSVTRRYGGTGLGLALSRRLAKVLGGDLFLEKSALGEGSVFQISIAIGSPCEEKTGETIGTSTRRQPDKYPQVAAHVRILIVDDSPDNRAIVGRFVKLSGAQFDTAENGQLAVDKALAEPFDLILMDIQMPVLDGYQALIKLRELNYCSPIVALTAHAMKEEREHCLSAGFNDYLSKPVDRRILLQLIQDLTGGPTGRKS